MVAGPVLRCRCSWLLQTPKSFTGLQLHSGAGPPIGILSELLGIVNQNWRHTGPTFNSTSATFALASETPTFAAHGRPPNPPIGRSHSARPLRTGPRPQVACDPVGRGRFARHPAHAKEEVPD